MQKVGHAVLMRLDQIDDTTHDADAPDDTTTRTPH